MINIHAKPAFLNTASNTPFISKELSYKGHGHLQRVSSIIRGDQIADYLGAHLNPHDYRIDDINIYVKPHVKAGEDFEFLPKSWIDIIDGWGLIPLLEKYTEVGVIACSKQDFQTLSFLPNKRVFIPQNHCNYGRLEKTMNKVRQTVGIIGTEDAFSYLPEWLEPRLNNLGISLIKYSKFFSRQDIVDFYMKIDVQLVWRPYRRKLSNPLKVVNASSFGIPTIAYEESVLSEMDGCYIPVKTFEEFIDELMKLVNDHARYGDIAMTCRQKAEDYHISKVAELYKQL